MLAVQRVSQCCKCVATRMLAQIWFTWQTPPPRYLVTVEDDTSRGLANCVQRSVSLSIPKRWCPPGEQWKSVQSGRFPQSRGAESEATRFCRCLGNASSSYNSLQNNDPSQRSDYKYREGRCRWWCASSGEPCNIVGCVVHSMVVKSGEASSLTHAWLLMRGCALPVDTLWRGFLSFGVLPDGACWFQQSQFREERSKIINNSTPLCSVI